MLSLCSGPAILGAVEIKAAATPDGSIGIGATLTSGGDLYEHDGTFIATDVVDFAVFIFNGDRWVRWVDSSGVIRQKNTSTGAIVTVGPAIAGAVSIGVGTNPNGTVGGGATLDSNGVLYNHAGVQIATDVADYEVFVYNGAPWVRWIERSTPQC